MRVLFVCLGNICRSPTAEGVFRALAERESPGLITRVDSAGTGDYHIGEPPDLRAQAAAAARGYDLSGLRARQIQAEDFNAFDLLLAMDRANLRALARLAPRNCAATTALMLEFAGRDGPREVPDPYYGGPGDFAQVVELVEIASRRILVRLASRPRQSSRRGGVKVGGADDQTT
jgi:protein-tyrosine phosphatase